MRFLIFAFILGAFPWSAQARAGVKSVKSLKKEAKERLLARKKGFDKHKKRLKDLEKKRLAKAFKMKAIRKKQADKREKARKSFVRKTSPFPRKAYQAFLAKREGIRKGFKKARQDYSQVQKEIEKVYKNKKYNINGKREYNLN